MSVSKFKKSKPKSISKSKPKPKSKAKRPKKRVFTDARKTEVAVTRLIPRYCNLSARHVGDQQLPFDVVVGGRVASVRLEVKDARRGYRGRWFFAIKRRGVLNENFVDFYVLALRGISKTRRIYVILKAPLKAKSVAISWRSLIRKYVKQIDAWHLISALHAERKREAETGETGAKPEVGLGVAA